VEDNFSLPSLGQADARADNLLDRFDFSQNVVPFTPVATKRDAEFFLHQRHVPRPNDPA